ncbi:response regulator transcription factor, partial [Actinomadura sp. NPDC049753]|uniref:response regulator transcription factor n=1 Tax=Actinomadura sp. NPDC049753 TaxID=3154739 RepID=UPI0034404EAF
HNAQGHRSHQQGVYHPWPEITVTLGWTLDGDPGAAPRTGPSGPLASLTGREREVLKLVAEGRNNREIAAALFISPKTASVHVSNILGKLNVSSRTQAAAVAHREGI